MKDWLPPLVTVLGLAWALFGCGSSATPQAKVVPPLPTGGSPSSITFEVDNYTPWTIQLGTSTSAITGQTGTLIIPSGGHADFRPGFLPTAVYVTAAIWPGPPTYTYPTKVLILGVDYQATDLFVGIRFP